MSYIDSGIVAGIVAVQNYRFPVENIQNCARISAFSSSGIGASKLILVYQAVERRGYMILCGAQVDSKVQARYEEKLAASLKDLREAYEQQMADNR